ncbi:hypothetical protein CHS0354_011640 [Potamilus streckersoni]|uniref:EGF-like domain-containing protein n=1 Tax=Potamilus streckersoni TaxID=2493646 RepID=A0AAE0TKM3_9BIVA|nr:hypothetical protein CHS0354_011640 [Potamilus streckersoni]
MESSYKYAFMCCLLITSANTIPVRPKRSLLPDRISKLNINTVNNKDQVIILTCKDLNLCRNGGTCHMAFYQEMRCICPNGFTGRMCESECENMTTTSSSSSSSSSTTTTTTTTTITTTTMVNFTAQTLTSIKVSPIFPNTNVNHIMGSSDTNPGKVTTVINKGFGNVKNLVLVTESNVIDNSIKQSTGYSGKASTWDLNTSKLQGTKPTPETSINFIRAR